jgi:hypothetical protein
MIRKMYNKKSKFYRVISSAPDGRFAGSNEIVGGVTEKTALVEAKKLSDYGLIVDIFNSKD